MERFNAACDWIADAAFRERTADKIRLQHLVYGEARERFGLSSQMVVRAISKVAEAYKRDRSVQPRFRAHGAMPYDERIMSWKGSDRVSLLTLGGREVVPYRFGEYQGARLDRIRGQADLVLRRHVFYLYFTVDAPQPPAGEIRDYLGIDLGIVNRRSHAHFLCVSCGSAAPADHNAARVIRSRAAVMQPMVSDARSLRAAPGTGRLR
jgi:putative transposase